MKEQHTTTTTVTARITRDKESLNQFLDPIEHIVFDCDGVLYRSTEFFPHVPQLLQELSKTKKLYFLTNNSRKSRAEYKKKFVQMGLDESVIADVYSSSYAAALYVKSNFNDFFWDNDEREKKVFVIGMEGIREELAIQGIDCIGHEFSGVQGLVEDELLKIFHEYTSRFDIKCVVMGFDSYFNLFKLGFATLCLREIPNCRFVVTNTDAGLPWKSFILPGTGTLVDALIRASNRQPDIVCGKPNTFLLDQLVEKHNVDPSSVLMVGDRLETDIRMANSASIRSMAVLSGASTIEDIECAIPIDQPTIVVDGLSAIYELLFQAQD